MWRWPLLFARPLCNNPRAAHIGFSLMPMHTSSLPFPLSPSSSYPLPPESTDSFPSEDGAALGAERPLQKIQLNKRTIALTACSFCQRRKIRCDQAHPCAQCTKRGLAAECAYPEARKRGRKVRDATTGAQATQATSAASSFGALSYDRSSSSPSQSHSSSASYASDASSSALHSRHVPSSASSFFSSSPASIATPLPLPSSPSSSFLQADTLSPFSAVFSASDSLTQDEALWLGALLGNTDSHASLSPSPSIECTSSSAGTSGAESDELSSSQSPFSPSSSAPASSQVFQANSSSVSSAGVTDSHSHARPLVTDMLFPPHISPATDTILTPQMLRQELVMKTTLHLHPVFPFMDMTTALRFAPHWSEEWENLSLSAYKIKRYDLATLVHAFSFSIAMANCASLNSFFVFHAFSDPACLFSFSATRVDAPEYTAHFIRKAELLYHILFFHEGAQTRPEWVRAP